MIDDTLVRLRLIAYNRRLVDARKARGWTQVFVAEVIGLKPELMSPVETLKVVPSADVMQEFADLYELPVEYLFPPSLMDTVERGAFRKRVMELGEPELYKLSPEKYRLLLPEPSMLKLEREDLARQIATVIDTLSPREKKVIQLRFGLDDGRSRTGEEVGKVFGVCRERIYQIERKALRKLRHPRQSRKLKDYLD